MLLDARRTDLPELGAFHEQIDLRSPAFRVGLFTSARVATDYALVNRAAPFISELKRPQILIVLEGMDRFDEGGKRQWIEPGEMMISACDKLGTDAIAGERARWIVLQWEPSILGADFTDGGAISRLGARDLGRIAAAADTFRGPRGVDGAVAILDVLRAVGVGFERVASRDLDALSPAENRTSAAIVERLTRLDDRPAVIDLAERLGTSERQVHRRVTDLARRYRYPWAHWRSVLHSTRMTTAIRWLSAGASTERVAQLLGLRSPTALCHAFDRAGLPSPGAIARAYGRHGLEGLAAAA